MSGKIYEEMNKDYNNYMDDIKLGYDEKGLFTNIILRGLNYFFPLEFMQQSNKFTSVKNIFTNLEKNKYIKKIHPKLDAYCLYDTEIKVNSNTGYLYVFGDNYGNFKIGKTTNITDRFETYMTHMPYKPSIIEAALCFDYSKIEKQLHEYFKDKRLNGEWFKLDNSDLAYIKQFLDGEKHE